MSDTITQSCGRCGHHLSLPDRYRGREMRCPRCGTTIVIGGQATQPAPPPAAAVGQPDAGPGAQAAIATAAPPTASAAIWTAYSTVERFDVASAATVSAALHAAAGLITGAILAFVLGGTGGDGPLAMLGAFAGILALIGLPIIYAVVGFVVGALGAWLYNLVARRVGGLKILIS